MLRLLLLSTFCLTLFQQLGATDKYWGGSSYGDWDEASNWSPAGIPTAADEVFIICDCSVSISGGYNAVAASVLIYDDASVNVYSNSSLEVRPALYHGIQIAGLLNNWGTVSVRNPNTSANQGVIVEDGGRINNWGSLNVSYTGTGILVMGRLVSWGDITINEAAGAGQLNGIYLNTGGDVTLFSNSDVSVNYTSNIAITAISNTDFLNYGEITIETGCTGRGFANGGDFDNYGNLLVRGATTDGFYNYGNLYNTGDLRFFYTASGDALYSNGGEIRNGSTGKIIVYGSQYENGIRFAGGGHEFYNQGLIDVYTGQSVSSSLYFNWGAKLTNTSSGEIKVRTYATTALLFNGEEFDNRGGTVELQCYGPNKNSLEIGAGCVVSNHYCGTITLDDRLSMNQDAELINSAWLEIMNDTEPHFYSGSLLSNGGVIYDRSGALENVNFSFIHNDEGVIVTAPTDAIVFGDPYTDYILAGPYTDVELDPVITNGNNEIGIYDEGSTAVYFDDNNYDDPKYFYAQVNIPGCENREYRVYNNTPKINSRPVHGGGNNWEYAGRPASGANTTAGLQSATITAFPNPAGEVLNLRLSNEFQGVLQFELRDLHGRSVFTSRQAAAPQLSLDRPANLPGGTYLLTITDTTGELMNKRVVFQ
ncbi:hypothetical protein CEQ90_11925 [Lewinellaceae bacterium SD302]|nr:hypothetical protein CEQ90_11925 [Lewinellaceae bacterium SD302]